MKLLRIILGALLLAGAGFCGGGAAFLSGSRGDLRFDIDRLFRPQAFPFALATIGLIVIGLWIAKSGRGPVAAAGVLLGLVAALTSIYGWIVGYRMSPTGLGIIGLGFALCVVSAVLMSRHRAAP